MSEHLTPTQNLFLEVLAARTRLGESVWTFESRHRPAAKALAEMGLIGWKSGIIERTILAWLTDGGRAEALSDTYQPPAFAAAQPIQKIGYPTSRTDEQIRSDELLAKVWSTVGPRFNRGIDLATQGLNDAEDDVPLFGGAG